MLPTGQHSAEVARRRTFAIISHPDAGKTTLTEQLLLSAGAIQVAGAVRRKGSGRHATSDWMAMERERGISITTSVLQFEVAGRRCNLLDTPGHNDFSEDTYRTLAAVDCAVMLVDAGKGVETQTRKLFDVCRMRKIPVITFINKMDRPAREPLELLDEIEKVLDLQCSPFWWPVGSGPDFRGVHDRRSGRLLPFEHASNLGAGLSGPAEARLREELDLLDTAGAAFDEEAFRAGRVTPVFFGSAVRGFGVPELLQNIVELAPPPQSRRTTGGLLDPHDADFTGFVFKIQANMDPCHRDRVAFLRVCSGRFQRGMTVRHARTGKALTLSRSVNFLAQERLTVDEAYAGDVLGVWDPGLLRIGDTVGTGDVPEVDDLPRFSPEHFARARIENPLRRKQLAKGLVELADEGMVQLLDSPDGNDPAPVLGAVGLLQLDVVRHRLEAEYGVLVRLDALPHRSARWLDGPADALREAASHPSNFVLRDLEGRPIALFETDWTLQCAVKRHPLVRFDATSTPARAVRPGSRARGRIG